ncbi:hypothetical protein, partial [Enterococcus sp. VV15]|uniref:hypothetical protein n=1 Tax=Enterococcus sp. VV15 TaxID=2233541 RepID=UPI001EE790EF
LWLKTLYRKRAVTWPFIFYTIIWTLSRINQLYFWSKKSTFFTYFAKKSKVIQSLRERFVTTITACVQVSYEDLLQ